MYIITYATHSERYFSILKESCPDLVVLGYGKKWNGLEDKVLATLEFCRQHPDDIICFIDGFDSVVLSSKDEILQKYKSLQSPLVMSRAAKKSGIHKYLQDKLFSKCKNTQINAGMFIGTSDSILKFWKDYQGGDVQSYATRQCRHFNMKIDLNHDIFYDYSPNDDIVVSENRLYVNGKAICVISGINPYLKQLGYSPPEIPYSFNYGIKTFLPEIIVFLAACACFCVCSLPWSIVLCFLLFTTLMEYELHIKHYPISMFYKMICLQLDILHVILGVAFIYLMLNVECNVKKLIFLNTMYLIIVLCFYYHKRCILTIIQNKLANKTIGWTAPLDRILYFFQDEPYINENVVNTTKWIEGNKISCILVVCLNLYCFTKL